MSAIIRVSHLKGLSRPVQTAPQQGTVLRELYDWFRANPCVPLKQKNWGSNREQLRDFYGLDIRGLGYGKGHWLVGEYDEHGRYIDHLAARIAELEARPSTPEARNG